MISGELLSLLARGSLELGLVVTALGVVGVRVGRLAGAEGGLHLVLHAFSAALVALIGLELLLLWVGWLNGPTLAVGCVGLAAALHLRSRRAPAAPATPPGPGSWLLWLPAAVAFGLAIARTGRRMLLPPVAGDALAYHLPMAAQWVQQGTLLAHDVRVWFYPGNAELVLAGVMLPFRADFLVGLPDLVYWAVGGLAVAGILEQLGRTPRTARLAGLVLVSSPLFVRTLGRCGSDLMLSTTFLLVVYFVVRAARTTTPRAALLLAASLLGVLCGTKYSALAEAALLGVFAVAMNGRQAWRALGPSGVTLAALSIALLGGSYYLRNLLLTGNPVYPIGLDLGFWRLPPGDHSLIIATAGGIAPDALARSSILRNDQLLLALRYAALHSWRLAGPLLLLPGLVAAGRLLARRSDAVCEVRARLALVGLLAGTALLFLATPFSAESVAGTLNQIAPGASLRYALPVFALLVVASLASTRLPSAVLDPILALLVLVQALQSIRRVPLDPLDVTLAACGVLGACWALHAWRPRWRGRPAALALVASAACLALVAGLAPVQEERRAAVYARALDSGVVAWLEQAAPGMTLMASIGMRPYPFFGRRLENRVVALGLTQSWSEWSERIDEVKPDLVLVTREQDDPHSPTLGSFPAQEQGLLDDPDRFRRVYADPSVRVYAVRSTLPAP